MGGVIEPRKPQVAEADVVNDTEGDTRQVETQGSPPGVLTCHAPSGSESGARAQGSSRNLGGLVTSGVGRNGGAKRRAERVGVRGVGVPQYEP